MRFACACGCSLGVFSRRRRKQRRSNSDAFAVSHMLCNEVTVRVAQVEIHSFHSLIFLFLLSRTALKSPIILPRSPVRPSPVSNKYILELPKWKFIHYFIYSYFFSHGQRGTALYHLSSSPTVPWDPRPRQVSSKAPVGHSVGQLLLALLLWGPSCVSLRREAGASVQMGTAMSDWRIF